MSHLHDAVFSSSLLGAKQDATLALHKCWGVEDAKERGGAPPPPLTAMIAAMLHSPTLAQVREAPEPATTTVAQARQGASAEALTSAVRLLEKCVKKGDAAACQEIKLPRIEGGEENHWDVYYVVSHIASDAVVRCVLAAVHDEQVVALAAALKSLYAICEPLCEGSPYAQSTSLCPYEHNVRHVGTPPAIVRVFDCIRRDGTDFGLDRAQLDAVLAEYASTKKQRQAALPMGDIRCLLMQRDDVNDAVRRIQRAVRSHVWQADAAINTLVELGREDVAAMLYAVLGKSTKTLWLTEVQRDARAAEMRYITSRTWEPTDAYTTPQALLIAHTASGSAVVRVASPASVEQCHVLLRRHAKSLKVSPYHDMETFRTRWSAIVRGVLDGWDWSHCLAAGGAVVRALVGVDRPEDDTTFGDVDLFFYGLSYRGVRERLQALERHVRLKVGAGHYAVLLTSRTMTIVIDGAPRLQVALGMWSSASDVLTNVDVDCCGAGFDGSAVFMTGRAAAAYASRINVASATRHMVRGSIQYEMRLWKYAQRYGFAVMDPLHWTDDDVVEEQRAQLRSAFTGQKTGAAKRRAATTLSGLRWLMAADLGLFTPTEPSCDLAVGDGVTVSDVVEKVTAKGYMESDNYGTHEEGYVVVREEETTTADEVQQIVDHPGYLTSFAKIHHSNFVNHLALRNMDALDPSKLEPSLWRLC